RSSRFLSGAFQSPALRCVPLLYLTYQAKEKPFRSVAVPCIAFLSYPLHSFAVPEQQAEYENRSVAFPSCDIRSTPIPSYPFRWDCLLIYEAKSKPFRCFALRCSAVRFCPVLCRAHGTFLSIAFQSTSLARRAIFLLPPSDS